MRHRGLPPLSDLFSASSQEVFYRMFPEPLEEWPKQANVELVTKDGRTILIDRKALVVYDGDGGIDGIIVSERDIVI